MAYLVLEFIPSRLPHCDACTIMPAFAPSVHKYRQQEVTCEDGMVLPCIGVPTYAKASDTGRLRAIADIIVPFLLLGE